MLSSFSISGYFFMKKYCHLGVGVSGQDGEGVVGALLQLGGGRHQHRAVHSHRHAAPHRTLPCLVLDKEVMLRKSVVMVFPTWQSVMLYRSTQGRSCRGVQVMATLVLSTCSVVAIDNI